MEDSGEPRACNELAMIWFWYIICCSSGGNGRTAMPVTPVAIAVVVALDAGTMRLFLLLLLPPARVATGRERVLAAAIDSSHRSGLSGPEDGTTRPDDATEVAGEPGSVVWLERNPVRPGVLNGDPSMS